MSNPLCEGCAGGAIIVLAEGGIHEPSSNLCLACYVCFRTNAPREGIHSSLYIQIYALTSRLVWTL